MRTIVYRSSELVGVWGEDMLRLKVSAKVTATTVLVYLKSSRSGWWLDTHVAVAATLARLLNESTLSNYFPRIF
jgi:hypothetical protein